MDSGVLQNQHRVPRKTAVEIVSEVAVSKTNYIHTWLHNNMCYALETIEQICVHTYY